MRILVPALMLTLAMFTTLKAEVALTINPSEIPGIVSTNAYAPIPTALLGIPLVTNTPGLTVTFTGDDWIQRNDNFALTAGDGTFAFDFDASLNTALTGVTAVTATHGGTISGTGARFDSAEFIGLGNAVSLIPSGSLPTNFTDVTAGTVGQVNKLSSSPSNSGTSFIFGASAPADSGSVLYNTNGAGNSGLFLTVDFAAVPEPSSLGLLALGGFGILVRRKRV